MTIYKILMYFKTSLRSYVWSLQRYVFSTPLIIILSTPISSEVQITIIDPWRIINAGEQVLLDNKFCRDCYVR